MGKALKAQLAAKKEEASLYALLQTSSMRDLLSSSGDKGGGEEAGDTALGFVRFIFSDGALAGILLGRACWLFSIVC